MPATRPCENATRPAEAFLASTETPTNTNGSTIDHVGTGFATGAGMATPSIRLAPLPEYRPLFRGGAEQAGAFVVEQSGPDRLRLVMREPHFANNVRYVLEVQRQGDRLRAYWVDSEDATPTGFVEVGSA